MSNARAIAQEHSYVPKTWRMADPDVLIYPDAGLETICIRRRMIAYDQEALREQHRRLKDARRDRHQAQS